MRQKLIEILVWVSAPKKTFCPALFRRRGPGRNPLARDPGLPGIGDQAIYELALNCLDLEAPAYHSLVLYVNSSVSIRNAS